MKVEMAHEICNDIEKDLQQALHNPKVLIHVEPEQERISAIEQKKTDSGKAT
ncbi:hypothetical protein D3C84_1188810 [compost metagenome]